jgi:hypothetical protein
MIHSLAIQLYKPGGPGFGVSDLIAFREPFNKEKACSSYANINGSTYRIEMDSEKIN